VSSDASVPDRVGSVLFVCLGNICRSPLARALFESLAAERGVGSKYRIDSCGTGSWHVGEDADPRTIMTAKKYAVPMAHKARQVAPLYDFEKFDLILAMDRRNEADLLKLGAARGKVRLMREFDAEARGAAAEHGRGALDVPDPYSGGMDGFDQMHHMLRRACTGLLDQLAANGRAGA